MSIYRCLLIACFVLICGQVPQAVAQSSSSEVRADLDLLPGFAEITNRTQCPAAGSEADRGNADRETAPLFVTIVNAGDQPLHVRVAGLKAPETDLKLCDGARETTIGPKARGILELHLAPAGKIRAGSVPVAVAFEVFVTGAGARDVVLAHTSATLEVAGVSDILGAIGVPSLLLLPGVLLLGAFALGSGVSKDWLSFGSLAFWIVSISISLAIALVYPALVDRPDLLQRFDLGDLSVLWTISLALGAGIGLLARIILHLNKASRTLKIGDSPLSVIEKLGRMGVKLPLQWSQTDSAFIFDAGGGDLVWAIPKAGLTVDSKTNPGAYASMRDTNAGAASKLASRVKNLKLQKPLKWKGADVLRQIARPQGKLTPGGDFIDLSA